MGYIGSQPATNFETVRKQVSTTNSGTTITLDYSVSSVQDILVTVNAVVQSYDNYSVSGTTLTLGGTLNNDRVEILYVGRTFQTVTPAVGTVTNDMLAGSIANSKLANSSVSINGSSVSLGGSITGIGEANTPSFRARLSSDQTVANQTSTKLALATEAWDTDSAWNTSNYNFTVPSGEGGKYFFYGRVRILSIAGHDSTNYFSQLQIRKDDATRAEHRIYDYSATSKDLDLQISKVMNLSAGEVIDFRVYHNGSGQSNQNISSSLSHTFFTGFKVTT